MWDEVRRQVEFELSQLGTLVGEHDSLLDASGADEPDKAHRYALGATLNSFYLAIGCQRTFERLATELEAFFEGAQ